jgi:hypothetical protein
MLQGNPFETELVMQERIRMVQQGVDPGRRSLKLKGFGKIQGWWRSFLVTLNRPRSSPRDLRPVGDQR